MLDKVQVNIATIVSTFLTVLLSMAADIYNISKLSGDERSWSLAISAVGPTLVAGPFFYLLFAYLHRSSVRRAELERTASTDFLTAVLNKGAFVMLVDAYLAETAKQAKCSEVSLLVVDADNFKAINDTYGHQTGDIVLKSLASTIKSSLRHADICGRVGGEEFCVFMPATGSEAAHGLAEKIRNAVEEMPTVLPSTSSVTVSVGGVSRKASFNFEQLFNLADANLYRAKSTGRNRVVFDQAA